MASNPNSNQPPEQAPGFYPLGAQVSPPEFQQRGFPVYPGTMSPPPYHPPNTAPLHQQPQMPGRAKSYFPTDNGATGYSSNEDRKPLTGSKQTKGMPGFVRKWFDLDLERKEDIREMRHKWIASKKENGETNPEKDFEGLKMIMPKYAAKWFVLSHDEKERYRSMRREKKHGADVPGFAVKWFNLSDRKKSECKKLRDKVRAQQKSAGSDSDEAETFEEAGIPQFAARWFSLPKAKKDEIRIKYRHSQKCKESDCDNLQARMNMLQMSKQDEAAAAYAPPNAQYNNPMMSPYGPQGQWMGPYAPPMYGPPQPQGASACMSPPPYFLIKRFYKSDSSTDEESESETDTGARPKPSVAARGSDNSGLSGPDVPKFVRKWFALPMEARQQLRMLKQYQKKHKSCGSAIPPFAKKWFALSHKKKQKWREMQRAHRADRCQSAPPGMRTTEASAAAAGFDSVPEFAAKWFALPVEQKYHLRMLNKYLNGSHSEDSSDTGDEFAEAMPEFAAKWFALSSEQRSQLRDMKHDKKFKKELKKRASEHGGGKKAASSQNEVPPYFAMSPWQQWAYTTPQPPMDYFRGQKTQGGYTQMKPEKDTYEDSDD